MNHAPGRSQRFYSDEVKKAQTATQSQTTIFDKIIDKTLPANIIHEDEKVRISRSHVCLCYSHVGLLYFQITADQLNQNMLMLNIVFDPDPGVFACSSRQ